MIERPMLHPPLFRRLMSPLVAVSALTLVACGGQSNAESSDGSSSASESAEVVARVNGTPITTLELDAQVQAMSKRGQSVPRGRALDELVDLKLMAQTAEDQGLPEQPEIAATIERQRATTLAQHLIRGQLSDFEVSEDKLRQAYKDKVSGMKGPEYKARHILVEDKKTATRMIQKLDDGADFTQLAKENSTGPTSKRGGSLGWFSGDQMVQPFSQAVQDLEPGNYTGEPVQTKFGWHVIQLEETRPVEKPEFKQMRSKLRNKLVGQKIKTYVEGLRKEADVEVLAKDLEDGGSGPKADGSGGQVGSGSSATTDSSQSESG